MTAFLRLITVVWRAIMFELIDIEHYDRKAYFLHYSKDVPCTYSVCVDIDVTPIKARRVRLYPTLIYLLSAVVNRHQNFRMSYDNNENLGYFNELNPSYTIFNPDNKNFCSIFTEFNEDFKVFYANCCEDIARYQSSKCLSPKENQPDNVFNISAIPWFDFSAFNLNLQKGYDYLLPIFTIGKLKQINHQAIVPLAIQVHHAVCDAYHIALFLEDLNQEITQFVGVQSC